MRNLGGLKPIFAAVFLAGAVSGFSQGQVDCGDYDNTDFQITVWSPQTGAAEFTEVQGNSPADFGTGLLITGPDIPAGTQTAYTGVPLGGSVTGPSSPTNYANGILWSVQLFAAPGADVPAYLLAPVPGTVANLSTIAADQGLYEATGDFAVEIPGVAPEGIVTLQLRAWYNGNDAYPNYTAALNAGQPTGQSTTGSETIGGDEFVPPDLPGPGNLGVSGGITSFSLVVPSGASNLIDVAFTGAAVTAKTGFAATGATPNDLWNTYVMNAGSLPNLEFADGTASGAGLAIANASEAATNGATDPMYGSYLYTNGANMTLTVTNLNQGVYDFYLYGHGNENDENSVFQLVSGGQSYGSEATTNGPGWLSSEWQEGVQYVRFAGVSVSSGQAITVTVEPGAGGYTVLAGLQMMQVGPMPVFIFQPTNQTIIEGSNAMFSVVASGATPLAYQWLFNNAIISGATNGAYGITGAQLADIGNYSVTVTNSYGSVTSLVATLDVIGPIAALIDVAFTDGAVTSKTGFAATGVTTNDFWNDYDTYPGSLSDLEFADGTASGASLTIAQQIASADQNGAPDPMFGFYVFAPAISMTLASLPEGSYDFYLYGHGKEDDESSVFQLTVGPTSTRREATSSGSGWFSPVWQEGAQYVEFTDVTVSSGQIVTITVEPGGAADYAVLSGLQIVNSRLYPTIVTEPSSQELFVGANATFRVVAGELGPFGYQWLSNNVVISGATNSSFTLTNVPASDAGDYSVLVSNPYGAVTSQAATLTVSNILILAQPVSQSVYQGASASFSILADASTPLAYQWLFNDAAIFGATNSSYTLTKALSVNAGNYSVIVSNSSGRVVSQIATLEVVNILIFTQPVNQVVDAGGSVTFTVMAAAGTPLAYQWMFNNAAIPGATNSSYSLTGAQLSDSGSYSVIVMNSYGSLTGQIATLTVTNISILTQPVSQLVYLGAGETFSIVATAGTPLAYQWMFNNAAIPGATNSSYSLTSVQPVDAGDYAVIMTNAYGSLTSQVATLTVTNILILTQPASQVGRLGASATFSIVATAGTPLAYQWMFNNAAIFGATNSNYSLASVQPDDAGNYFVLVSNAYGSVTSAVATLSLVTVIDLAFTGASVTSKSGLAATGINSNDFWNTYDVITTSDLPNLKFIDGMTSRVGLGVANVWSVYGNGSSDPMYGVYAYAPARNIILTITNLYWGIYDFYLYGHGNLDDENGVFELIVGSRSYGTEATTNGPGWLSPVWQEGVQYVEFPDVVVLAGQKVTITVEPGVSGYAVISGLQTVPLALGAGGLPLIVDVSNQIANIKRGLIITNYAYSTNGPVSFTLAANAPAGADITPDGVFTWEPTCGQGSTTNSITVWATDSGNPPQSNSMTFSVVVSDCVQVSVGSSPALAGQGTCLPVSLLTTVPLTNLSFSLSSPSGLLTNWNVTSSNLAIASATAGLVNTPQPQFNFEVQSGQVLQGSNVIGSICLDTLPGAASSFVPLPVFDITALASDNSQATNRIAQNGRVVLIGPQSLLDSSLDTNSNPTLTLYGHPGATYDVLTTTNLLNGGSWSSWETLTLSDLFQIISLGSVTNQMQFYRAVGP